MPSYTILVPIVVTVGNPGEQNFQVTASARPSIRVPKHIPRKQPVPVTVNGRSFVAPAAIARVLAKIAGGAERVLLRPELHSRLCSLVPELRLSRDHLRKLVHGGAWWVVG